MATMSLEELVKQTEQLTLEEQLALVAQIAERARSGIKAGAQPSKPARRKWREIRGMATYPMLGEDAQAWVSRTRREGDEARERQWRRTP